MVGNAVSGMNIPLVSSVYIYIYMHIKLKLLKITCT
jgi:hypothetical protein